MKKSANGLIIAGALAGFGCLVLPLVAGALGGLFWFSAGSEARPVVEARHEVAPDVPPGPVPAKADLRHEPAEPEAGGIDRPEGEPGASALPRAARVRSGIVETHGGLARHVIQRVVRRHSAEIRFCYEQALSRRPSLEGRVVVSFVVGSDGRVTSSEIGSTTLNDEAVEACIARAVQRWTFPGPEGGGAVTVNYPFVLSHAPAAH